MTPPMPTYPPKAHRNSNNQASKRWTLQTAADWFDANDWPGVGVEGARGEELARVVAAQNAENPEGLD